MMGVRLAYFITAKEFCTCICLFVGLFVCLRLLASPGFLSSRARREPRPLPRRSNRAVISFPSGVAVSGMLGCLDMDFD